MKRGLILLTLGLFSLMQEQANGCGWGVEAEEFRFWLLQPEVAEASELQPFYFTTAIFNGPDEQAIKEVAYRMNLAEWRTVTGPDVPEESIVEILYGTSPEVFWAREKQLFAGNAFLLKLNALGRGWPAYIRYAKQCEQLVNVNDPWGFGPKDTPGIGKAWIKGQKLLKEARGQELRARIAYQLVRLANYAPGLKLDAQKVYNKELAPLRGKSWLEPSAAFYVAAILQNPARDLAFAELFDRATDKRFRMVQLFDNAGTENYLAQATSDQQRASLLVMRSLQHPGRALGDLERIAAWDPGNRHLPLLLCRETNKLEDWLLTPPLTGYPAAIRQWAGDDALTESHVAKADLAYLDQVKAFIKKILPQATAEQQPLLRLLDGHLSLVAGNMPVARMAMERVIADPAASTKARLQAHIDRVLAGIMASKQLSDAISQDILELVQFARSAADLTPDSQTLLDQLHLYIGKKLIARGELPEGAFLLARTRRAFDTPSALWGANARHVVFDQAVPADYDRMIALLDKPDKTAFEQYLTGTGPTESADHTWRGVQYAELTREKLLDYKATLFLREGMLLEAAAVFRQIPDAFWEGAPYALFADDDPFVVNMEDPHNYTKTDQMRYNKRTIVERMIRLQREAELEPAKRALNNYLLGNAWFNMGWHGKYWIMSRIGWSVWGRESWARGNTELPGDADYYGCFRARHHYQLALKEASDPVLQAMACRMALECERNWRAFNGDPDLGAKENPFLAQLNSPQSRQAYRAIEDCSGYADFVARFR